MLTLDAAGVTVAMKCNLRAGADLCCFKIAHDPAYASSSPGILLEVDNMVRFEQDETLARMDSCADPDNSMINRLWSGCRRHQALLLAGRTLSAAFRPFARRRARIEPHVDGSR